MTAPPNCDRCNQPMVRVAFTKSLEIFNCRPCCSKMVGAQATAARKWANPAEFDEALRELEIHGIRVYE